MINLQLLVLFLTIAAAYDPEQGGQCGMEQRTEEPIAEAESVSRQVAAPGKGPGQPMTPG